MSSEAPENSQQATHPAGESQNGVVSQPPEEENPVAPPPEPRMPTRKDVSLRELLSKMDENAPIVRLSPPTLRSGCNDD